MERVRIHLTSGKKLDYFGDVKVAERNITQQIIVDGKVVATVFNDRIDYIEWDAQDEQEVKDIKAAAEAIRNVFVKLKEGKEDANTGQERKTALD